MKKYKKYCCAIIRNEDEILCHKVNDNDDIDGKWEFPSILVSDNNKKNIEKIISDIHNKLNYNIQHYSFWDTVEYEYDSYNVKLYINFFHIKQAHASQTVINKNYEWFKIKDLAKINLLEENRKSLYFIQWQKIYDNFYLKNPSKEVNKALSMYITARQFKNAITYSYENKNGRIYNRSIPYIVNLVFSCELYLKLIYYIKGIKYKHNHEIYDLIKDRNTLIDIFSDNNMKRYDEEYIICELLKIDNAFKNWRYHYESDYSLSIDDRILKNLIDILENISIKLCDDEYPDAGINWGFINSIY